MLLDTALFVLATAAVLATSHRVAIRFYPHQPWTRLMTIAVLAIAEVVVVSQALGALGLMNRWWLLLASMGIAAAVLLIVDAPTDVRHVRWTLPTWLTVVLTAFGVGMLAVTLGRPGTGLDTLQYHYPLVVEWMNSSDLTTPKTFGIANYAWYYPSNGELLQHWSVVWFRQDFLVAMVAWVFFGVAIAAVAGVVKRLGASLTVGAVAGLAIVTAPTVWGSQLRSGQVDLVMTALLMLGVFYFLGFRSDRRLVDAAMGGVAIGLAAGTKFVALPFTLILGFVFLVGLVLMVRGRRIDTAPAARAFGVMAAATLVTGGFWYMRNWVQTGSPLFPSSLFGSPEGYYPIPLEGVDFTILDYVLALDPHRWIVLPWVALSWGLGLVAVFTLVALPVWAIRNRHDLDWSLLLVGWVTPLLLLGAYMVTPTSAGGPEGLPALFAPNVRYAIPFLTFALVGAVALLERTRPRWGLGLSGGLIGLNLVHLGLRHLGIIPLGGPLETRVIVLGLAFGVVATAAAVAVVWVLRRAAETGSEARLLRPATISLGLVGALVLGLGAGLVSARYYSTNQRYGFIENGYGRIAYRGLVPELARSQPDGAVIAHAGLAQNYPLYGAHLQNTVLLAAKTEVHEGNPRAFESNEELSAWTCEQGVEWLVARDALLVAEIDDEEKLETAGTSKEEIEQAFEDIGGDGIESHEADWARDNPDLFELDSQDESTSVFRVDRSACEPGAAGT